jgi:subtilisin family serine protease
MDAHPFRVAALAALTLATLLALLLASAASANSRASSPLIDWWQRGATTILTDGGRTVPSHGSAARSVWSRTKGAGVVVADVNVGVDLSQSGLRGATLPGVDFSHSPVGMLDQLGHGTAVAGLIAGRGGRNLPLGIAPQAEVLPLKIGFMPAPADGSQAPLDLDQIAAAISYAAEQPAVRVINLSLSGSDNPPAEVAALALAAANDKLVVASAGNEGVDNDQAPVYPCQDTAVLCVAASARDDSLPRFASWGATAVALAAPGNQITVYRLRSGSGLVNGSSYAAPIVAGVAALLFAAHPEATASQVRAALVSSVTVAPWLTGMVASGGIVNAPRALAALDRALAAAH